MQRFLLAEQRDLSIQKKYLCDICAAFHCKRVRAEIHFEGCCGGSWMFDTPDFNSRDHFLKGRAGRRRRYGDAMCCLNNETSCFVAKLVLILLLFQCLIL